MPPSRAPAEPNVTSFESTVAAVHDAGEAIELDETYFYPAGGGQPADRGTLGDVPLEHVEGRDDTVLHHLAEPSDLREGDHVVCQVDPSFRRYCRRAHTASHVLYGAGRRLFDELGYGGFDIDPERVRVDFTVSEGIDDETLVELERLTNRAMWESREVSWETVDRETALDRPEVAFNTATEEGLAGDTVRLVTVDEWDVAACGGTHVDNTVEIGPVAVLERSNPGEGLTRVEFAVGPTAIDRRAAESRALRRAASALGAPTTAVDEAVADLEERHETAAAERDKLKSAVLEARLAELPVRERDGVAWRIGTIEGFGPNEVGEAIREPEVDVVAVAGRDGATFVVVASGDGPPAGSVVEDITAEFGGGGGGSPAFAQGGGLDADPEAIVGFLETY